MNITIEETLAASDVTTALTTGPYLIYSEVLEGARRPLSFLQVVEEIFDLIGQNGHTIQFLSATQLSATAISEATMLATGMTPADKTLSAVSVAVSQIIYSAVQLSDILKEDYPKVDLVQIQFRNMGKACMEYLDALVYSTISGTAGIVTYAAGASMDYTDCTNALASMENNDWVPDMANPPFLITSPDQAAILMQSTTFVTTERYTAYELSRIVQGEAGLYAGMRVLKSSLLDGTGLSFIVFPPKSEYGPVVVLAWKRRLTIKNEREERYGYTYVVTTVRAKPVVVQALGVCKISTSASP